MASDVPKRVKRFLFIGPTGVGKSTLINILFNDNVDQLLLSKPAPTSNRSTGSTSCFTTYYNFPYYAYTDSIGFGDDRFSEENLLSMLKATIKNSMVGYNKVFLCINYGRISNDIRYYIELLIVIFGKKILKWCTIVFTHCADQKMTKEKYIELNKNDKYIIDIINSVGNVIFGDNMYDEELESTLFQRRQRLLSNLKEDIDKCDTDYYISQPENFVEWLQMIWNMFTRKHIKQVKSCFEEIEKIAVITADLMTYQNFANYYGECSICSDDMWNTDSVFTQCHHIYHERCINNWLDRENSNCPLCRTVLDKKKSFLTSLYFDWEFVENNQM